jgi:hypothetical protein
MFKYFLILFAQPTKTIKEILKINPSFKRLVFFLFWIGLLRGLVEIVLFSLEIGQFSQVITSLFLLKNFLLKGTFILSSSISFAYFRWVVFAFIVYFLGRILGGRGGFSDCLKVYGLILGIYLVTVLPNFAYLFWRLPMIRFEVSNFYVPSFRIGQVITSLWLVFISYKATKIIHNLSWFNSLLVGFSIPLINVATLVFVAFVFFKFSSYFPFSQEKIFTLINYGLIIIPLILAPVFLYLGYKIEKKR